MRNLQNDIAPRYRSGFGAACALAVALLAGCSGGEAPTEDAAKQASSEPAAAEKPAAPARPGVVIKTNHGDIEVELYPDKAPKTVENFLAYANAKHYDGTIFHRVIRGFMIQGGGFDTDRKQKKTNAPIKNEADNGLKNERGTVAMARTSVPDSATAQFFVNTVDNEFLNFKAPTVQGYGYAVFGRVVGGMDVVDKIESTATANQGGAFQNLPTEPVIIESVRPRG